MARTNFESVRAYQGGKVGVARLGHHLVYAVDHGWLLWAPGGVTRLLVRVWNAVACTLLGHDTLIQDDPGGPAKCVSCCRAVPRYAPWQVIKTWEIDGEENEKEGHDESL